MNTYTDFDLKTISSGDFELIELNITDRETKPIWLGFKRNLMRKTITESALGVVPLQELKENI